MRKLQGILVIGLILGCNSIEKSDPEISKLGYDMVSLHSNGNKAYTDAAKVYLLDDGKITESEYKKLDKIYANGVKPAKYELLERWQK